MAKKIYERKRRRPNITLSQMKHTISYRSPSRTRLDLSNRNIMNAKTELKLIIIIKTQKGSGPAEARTQDLPVISRVHHRLCYGP
jgi:hypothetical protein